MLIVYAIFILSLAMLLLSKDSKGLNLLTSSSLGSKTRTKMLKRGISFLRWHVGSLWTTCMKSPIYQEAFLTWVILWWRILFSAVERYSHRSGSLEPVLLALWLVVHHYMFTMEQDSFDKVFNTLSSLRLLWAILAL